MHFIASRSLTLCHNIYLYDPGMSSGFTDQCILGDVCLRSNVSYIPLLLPPLEMGSADRVHARPRPYPRVVMFKLRRTLVAECGRRSADICRQKYRNGK